jgi:adenylate cyclase
METRLLVPRGARVVGLEQGDSDAGGVMARGGAAIAASTLTGQTVRRAAPRRTLLAIVILGLVGALCAPLFADPIAHDAPGPKYGAISFTRWGALTKPVELDGGWVLVWHGDRARGTRDERLPIKVPGSWGGLRAPDGWRLPENGFATYELTVRGLQPGQYLLYVPIIHAASRVSINGAVASSMGIVGNSPGEAKSLPRSHEVPITSDGKPLQIAIDVAAFHEHTGGLEGAPVIGLSSAMRTWAILKWSQDYLLRISLLLLAVYGLVLFVFRPDDRASLYLGLGMLCFLPVVSTIGYDNFLPIVLAGLSFPALLAVQYLVGTLSAPFFLAYANALFPNESPRPFYLSFIILFAISFLWQAALFAVGDLLAVTEVARYDTFLAVLSLAYIVVVVSIATIKGRDGALIFLFGVLVFATTCAVSALVLNDVVDRDRVIGADLIPFGTLILLFSHIIILGQRSSTAILTAEEITADLRRLIDVSSSIISEVHLDSLLRKIVEATSKFVQAERSSLFLYNAKTHQLTASVAEGLDDQRIHFDADLGLAGHSFKNGEIIDVEDAYEDPRFNRAVDGATGYRTRSVLTIPVITRDGRRLGVMQALNRPDATASGAADIPRMNALAAQAAIAIDNATLFTEVVSARNYNESILRSMSNGVITLDADGRIAKLNPSGAAIMELNPDDVVGTDAHGMLEVSNPWMLDELAGVRADHQPRRLVDVDVRTATGRTISANILIVPLVVEGESEVGLLILIEDISQEKRLEGAMRRFMTQKVVDQVLQRQDDLLFGAACDASVMFADIRNFTSMAEALSARETVEMLNELFAEVVETVSASDGVIDKFIGDAVMAVFGVPLSSGRDPANAVECATAMMQALDGLNRRRLERSQPELSLGVGIATGEVVAGTIGSPKRMDYTVIGDSVNLASRLQALTKLYKVGIIICEATASAVNASHIVRELDLIRVRGRRKPEKIFQLMSGGDQQPFPNMDEVLTFYRRGRMRFLDRDWSGAAAEFGAALALNPTDRPSEIMLRRATMLEKSPPGPHWDGVWSAEESLITA